MTGPVVDVDPSRTSPGETGDRVPDAVLGAVVAVPGESGSFALPILDARQPRTALSLTAWVRWGGPIPGASDDPPDDPLPDPADPSAPVVALRLSRQDARRTRVEVDIGGERFGRTVALDADAPVLPASGPALHAARWHHLAVEWDGPARTARLLVDGEVVAEHPTVVDHLPFRRGAGLAIVKRRRGSRRLLVGPVRLHDRLRTPAELLTERLRDLAAHPTVDESAPLAFRLSDALDEPTLSITDDDAPGRGLHVVLANRSPFPVTLPPADAPREERLELRFRPGTLAGPVGPGSPGWLVEPVLREDGGVSLFVAPAEPLVLGPGRSVAVTLDHLRAAGEAGSHGTHVELRHPHPFHPPLFSTRVAVARVVGRRGRRRSPLRFGVAGDPTVLPDGTTPNTLRLYVANSSAARPVTLAAPVEGVGTTFVLAFDAGDPEDGWALATTDQLLAARVSVETGHWRIEVDAQDESPEWILTPVRDLVLGPSERFTIVVDQLVCGPGPAGRTRVGLRCENVPGYWDDDRTVDVERSLVLRDRAEAALHVHGEIHDRYGEMLPPGTIVMWHGHVDDIPPGWVLCDGDNRTPELVGRFVRAQAPRTELGAARQGGVPQVVVSIDQLPSHHHLARSGLEPHQHVTAVIAPEVHRLMERTVTTAPGQVATQPEVAVYVPRRGDPTPLVSSSSVGVESVEETSRVGLGKPLDLPAHYDLCFIMKRFPPDPAKPVAGGSVSG